MERLARLLMSDIQEKITYDGLNFREVEAKKY